MNHPTIHEIPTLKISTFCPMCGETVGIGAGITLPETELPELEFSGDPSRLIAWHNHCAPEWVKQKFHELTVNPG